MSDRVFYCPECGQHFAETRRPPRGELFDCSRCHLLFVPGDRDFAGGAGSRQPEDPPVDPPPAPVRAPRPPYSGRVRRRKRKFQSHELLVPWVTGAALLLIAGVLFFVVNSKRPPAIVTAPPDSNRAGSVSDRSEPQAPVADAPGSTKTEPTATPPPVAQTPGSTKPTRLDEETILGEWESHETPLIGIVGGEVFSIAFQPRGALTVQARTVLEIATLHGGWKLSGSALTLRLGGQEIPVTAELRDADTLRLTVGAKAAEFKRKKN